MLGMKAREARRRLLRPLARGVDAAIHNCERRRAIHRYRRVDCVVLVADLEERKHAARIPHSQAA
jgi:hypothetical protein